MLIWCDFIEGFILEDSHDVSMGLDLFGMINDEWKNLGYIYFGY